MEEKVLYKMVCRGAGKCKCPKKVLKLISQSPSTSRNAIFDSSTILFFTTYRIYILRYQKIQAKAKKRIRVTTFNVKNCRKNKME